MSSHSDTLDTDTTAALRLALEAEKHSHRKDNEHLLAENQRLRDALEQIADEGHDRCAVNFGQAIRIARAALDGTPSATQTLEEPQTRKGSES